MNACCDVGCTPLHEAAANGHKEATIKLLELNANPNIKEIRYNLTAANLANEKHHGLIRDILCNSMTYQQCFIQNVNYILFNNKRMFFPFSAEVKFIDNLSNSIISIEDGDEVFKKVSAALKAPEYASIQNGLSEMRKLLIANMKQYNADKISAMQKSSHSSSSTETLEGTTIGKPRNY